MTNCIIWNGTKWAQGRYGKTKINGRSTSAHRAAWIKKYGEIPKGLVVCHKCDNGLCINIDHLFLGTMKENMRDCIEKGRFSPSMQNQKGSLNNNAKCNVEERNKALKEDRIKGLSFSQLRKKYGIKSNGHLCNMLRN